MKTLYISEKAPERLASYLERSGGYKLEYVTNHLDSAIGTHADLYYCRMGASSDAPVFSGDPAMLGDLYPKDAKYNAACTGKFFIHNLKITEAGLLFFAHKMNMRLIDVKQGYAKCSTVVVDEDSIITADRGIARACASDLNVLLIEPGHVELEGFPYGFIGGASGRVRSLREGEYTENPASSRPAEGEQNIQDPEHIKRDEDIKNEEIVFAGDLTRHPNFDEIVRFINDRGLAARWFEEFPLTDIGGMI